MNLSVQTAQVTTPSDEEYWSSCVCEGNVFVLLEINTGKSETSAVHEGKQLQNQILSYLAREDKTTISLSEYASQLRKKAFPIRAVIGLMEGDMLHLATIGQCRVFLLREGIVGIITQPNQTMKGMLKNDDAFLFYSDRSSSILTRDKAHEILNCNSPEDAIADIEPLLLSLPNSKGIAVLVSFVSEAVPDETSQVSANGRMASYREKLAVQIKENKSALKNYYHQLLSGEEDKMRRILFVSSILLSTILLGSIGINILRNQNSKERMRMNEVLTTVSHQYEEAGNLIDLSPQRARQLLSDSKISVTSLLKEFPKNSTEYKTLTDWLQKISEREVTAYKIYKLTAVPVFFDLTLIKSGGAGEKISVYQNIMAILDTKNKVAYTLATDTKQAQVLAGSDVVKDAATIAVHGTAVYTIGSNGISAIDTVTKSASVVVPHDDLWGDDANLASFGGNLYVLSKKNNAVYKYMSSDSGFSQRYNYVSPGVKVNFSEVSDYAIDGSIWVAAGKDVIKLTSGLIDKFDYQGFSDTITQVDNLATNEDAKNIYILDKTLSRIIVFDKDGIYQSQYQWDELKDVTSLAVSGDEKKIFILKESKIFAIEIK